MKFILPNELLTTLVVNNKFVLPNELLNFIILHDNNFDSDLINKTTIHIYPIVKLLNKNLYTILNDNYNKTKYKIHFTRILINEVLFVIRIIYYLGDIIYRCKLPKNKRKNAIKYHYDFNFNTKLINNSQYHEDKLLRYTRNTTLTIKNHLFGNQLPDKWYNLNYIEYTDNDFGRMIMSEYHYTNDNVSYSQLLNFHDEKWIHYLYTKTSEQTLNIIPMQTIYHYSPNLQYIHTQISPSHYPNHKHLYPDGYCGPFHNEDDKPAIITRKICRRYTKYYECYMENGKIHRDTNKGPAIIVKKLYNDNKLKKLFRYVENGKLHNLNGPAEIQYVNDKMNFYSYIKNGVIHQPEDESTSIWLKSKNQIIHIYMKDGMLRQNRCINIINPKFNEIIFYNSSDISENKDTYEILENYTTNDTIPHSNTFYIYAQEATNNNFSLLNQGEIQLPAVEGNLSSKGFEIFNLKLDGHKTIYNRTRGIFTSSKGIVAY